MSMFLKSTIRPQYFTLKEIKPNIKNATSSIAFSGWMAWVRVDSLKRGSSQTQFNLFFWKAWSIILWSRPLRLSFPIRPRREVNWLLSKWSSRRRFLINRGMKSPPPRPLSGMSFGRKLRRKKKLPSFGRLFIKPWPLMNGVGKSRQRLTKVAPTAACSQWNRLKTCSL